MTELISEKAPYRRNTKNLVLVGVGDMDGHVEKTMRKLRKAGVRAGRIVQARSYETLPDIMHDQDPTSFVYVVSVSDFTGTYLANLGPDVAPFLEPFDTVEGLFYSGGESEGTVAQETIKLHGVLAEHYQAVPATTTN